MKWMKERDLLIAQTMAFVQSVTGKPPESIRTPDAGKTLEAGQTIASPATPLFVGTFEPARPAALAPPDLALADVALAFVQTASPSAKASAVAPAAEVEARIIQAPIVAVSAEAPREISNPVPFSLPDLREDFQSEIRARVASFRAHQERFSREREAYCAATMAKVHATLKEIELPPPRPGK
jgi:hypothetical protein